MYLQDLWKQILFLLAREVPKNHMITWFSNTAILESKEGALRVGVPHAFAQGWISQHQAILLKCAKQANPEIEKIEIEVDGGLLNPDDLRSADISQVISATTSEKKVRKVRNKMEVTIRRKDRNGEEAHRSSFLNPIYTLDNFIVGKDNELAHAVCVAISRKPGHNEYNPLFIYGGVGLGKTHLLQATGNEILSNNSDSIVLYLTAEHFVNQVVGALRNHRMDEIRRRFRQVDCLILDDIHFFARKDRNQEEFFHTFNDLRDAGKQLILSSDHPPKELEGIENRLKSRFESGMVTEVFFPEFETRLAILQKKCQEMDVILAPQILECIAMNTHESVRELEGYVKQLKGGISLAERQWTVREVIEIMRRQNGKREVVDERGEAVDSGADVVVKTAADVISSVSRYFRIPEAEITGQSRRKEILLPRQLCMYLIYEILQYSFDTIGDYFEGRNHTTVLHAYHKISRLITVDQKMASHAVALRQAMGV